MSLKMEGLVFASFNNKERKAENTARRRTGRSTHLNTRVYRTLSR